MGYTLEENLERIAEALVSIAKTQEGMLDVALWNKARLAPAEVKAEVKVETPLEAPVVETYDYETLKQMLVDRGVTVQKGTKMTTLNKLWGMHKDDPVVQKVQEAEVIKVEDAPLADSEVVQPDLPAKLEDPKPVVEEKKELPHDLESARTYLSDKGFTGTAEQREAMRKALLQMGKDRFADLVGDEYATLCGLFESNMKGE